MGKKKTHEQFVGEVKDLFCDDYSILGTYQNTSIKILVKHNICNYEWDVLPNNFLKELSKCPQCSGKKRHTTESFSQIINEITNGEYIVLGEYVNLQTKIKMKHSACDYEWEVSPNLFKDFNTRCPRCQNRERYTTEDYAKKVLETSNNEYVLKSDYINNRKLVDIEHLACNNVFKVSPSGFMYGNQRCPACCDNSSKGEKQISELLSNRNIEYIQQYTFDDCKHINLLRFDFAINLNEKLILIEFDGGQHFFPVDFAGKGKEWAEEQFKKIKLRDQIKNSYCKEKGISLFRVPYWKFGEINTILIKLINGKNLKIDKNFIIV